MRSVLMTSSDDAARRAALAMGIDMKACLKRYAGIEHGRSHQSPPQQRAPIFRPRLQRVFIEQAVVARRQRVVHDDLNARLGQPSELIEIAERIQKGHGPGISAAGGIGGFGEPDRLARREPVAKRLDRRPARGRCPTAIVRKARLPARSCRCIAPTARHNNDRKTHQGRRRTRRAGRDAIAASPAVPGPRIIVSGMRAS